MLVQRKEAGNSGMFYAENQGKLEAEMTYHMDSPGKMVIEHTEVGESLRGHHVGVQLVQAAVEYARQQNLKIIVWCPFAKKVFDKNPDWHDVLDR